MNNLKVIYVNWTKPYFERKNFTGIKSYLKETGSDGTQYIPEDYEKLMQIYSFTSVKRHIGCKIKMYTDTAGYEYYQRENMLQYFDEVDTEFLDNLNKSDIVNAAQFWTSGKILSICNEEPPFLFLDTDFFLLDKIPDWVYKTDVTHAHWELLRSWLYVAEHRVKDFGLDIPEFAETMLLPNTCFLFMNDNQLVRDIQKRYKELHLHIVGKKYNYVPDELWLMTDQNILGYILRDKKANVGHAKNKIYIQFSDSGGAELVGNTPRWTHFDNIQKYTPEVQYHHVWFEKIFMHRDPSFKETLMKDWEREIQINLKHIK